MDSFVCSQDKRLKGSIVIEGRLIGNVEQNKSLKGRIVNAARLVGSIEQNRNLKGRIVNEARLVGTVGQNKKLKGKIVIQTNKREYDNYNGSYEVNPKIEDQLLPTKEKYLRNDIKIKSIFGYLKLDGSYYTAANIYKKVNDIWTIQNDLETIFEDGKQYVLVPSQN